MRLQQAVQKLEELFRGQVAIHTLVLSLHGDVRCIQSVSLQKDKEETDYYRLKSQMTKHLKKRKALKPLKAKLLDFSIWTVFSRHFVSK